LIALAVDGVDGTLARAFHIQTRLPLIDGAALDLVIDYLNYVLVPTFLIWRAGFLLGGAEVPLAAAILLSSLYVFARRDMKTADGYFRGFPALWNVVAVYFVLAVPRPGLASLIVLVLVILTFAPIHVVHPFRVADARRTASALAFVWATSTVALLVPNLPAYAGSALLSVSLITLLGLVAIGLRRTFRPGSAANK
jgi:phosphatidylcholine synthase